MTYTDIVADTHYLASTDSGSYPIADITRNANRAYDRVVSLLIESSGRNQFDDKTYTDLPIGTTSLVADQQDYGLDFNFLKITRIELKDSAGNWQKLTPLDQTDIYDQSLTDFLKTSGQPLYYDILGDSVFLYPKPNYSQSASLKIFYQREPNYFTTADTTKEPGFNSLYHRLISLWAAYDYCYSNQVKVATSLRGEIQILEDQMKEDNSLRNKDDVIGLRARVISFK